MKLGDVHSQNPHRFLVEQLFEDIWPFKKLSPQNNILLVTLFYLDLNFTFFLYFDIPMFAFIAGLFATFNIAWWNFGILRYADKIRDVKIEQMTEDNLKFFSRYLDELFSSSSIILGLGLSILIYMALLSPHSILYQKFINSVQGDTEDIMLNPFFQFYIFLIIFDISYRIGHSIYVISIQITRNRKMRTILKDPQLKTCFTVNDLRELEHADSFHFLALSGGLFLFPLAILDPILIICLIFYLILIFLFDTINIFQLRHLKSFF
ncbi:MAG: hypothetical protein ACXAC7_20140 [Candidatus Hodarchaeales archaeon]|jgi:hypothetical protein